MNCAFCNMHAIDEYEMYEHYIDCIYDTLQINMDNQNQLLQIASEIITKAIDYFSDHAADFDPIEEPHMYNYCKSMIDAFIELENSHLQSRFASVGISGSD